MKRVVVTGAGGFVGRHVLRALKGAGVEVTAVLRAGRDLPDDAVHAIRTRDLFAEPTSFWRSALCGYDAILHLAWYTARDYMTAPHNLSCAAGSLRLAEGAMLAGVPRFVGIGTCVEYDLTTDAVSAGEPLSSTSPIGPQGPYGAAKAATWLALSEVLPAAGVSFAWCRLFHLFGEGEDPRRLVPSLHAKLAAGEPVPLSSGRQVRDYMDAAEAGRQIAAVVLGQQEGAINICSGRSTTIAEIAREIAQSYGRPDLLRLGELPDRPGEAPFIVGRPSFPTE